MRIRTALGLLGVLGLASRVTSAAGAGRLAALAPAIDEAEILAAGRAQIVVHGESRAAVEHVVRRSNRLDRIWLDPEPPYRLLRWERDSGHSWELVQLKRLPYWRLNQPGAGGELPSGFER